MPPIPPRPSKIPGDLQRRATIACIGDSRTTADYPNATPIYVTYAVRALAGRLQWVGNYATGGYTAAQVRATHLPQVLALNPRPTFCVVLAGTNDLATRTAAEIVDDLRAMYVALRGAGITPVCLSELPRDLTAVSLNKIAAVNSGIAAIARSYGFPFVDVYPLLCDPATGQWSSSATYETDGVHPIALGHKVIGDAIATALSTLIPPFSAPLVHHAADTTTAVVAPTFAAGFTDANADSLPDNSGSLSGYSFFNNSAANATVTYGADSGVVAGRWLHIERSAADATIDLRTNGGVTCSAGDVVEIGCRYKVTGMGADNEAFLFWTRSDSTSVVIASAMSEEPNDVAASTFYGVYTVPSGYSGVRMIAYLSGSTGPTLSIGQMTMRNLTTLGVV